jgi:Protein of unknown function (DUF2851)
MRAAAASEAAFAAEAELAALWAAAPRGPLWLADGRTLRIVFPGVPGGGSGPDFRGAILEAGGDLLRGDVEIHLRASGWRAHGHHADAAYREVVLHVAGVNDTGAAFTLHGGARAIPVLVLPRGVTPFPPPFTPPCALAAARGGDFTARLERLSLRRLRVKAARASHACQSHGPGQALYAIALEQLGGSANREPFAAIARRLPLAALLERADGSSAARGRAIAAELKGVALGLVVRRAGLRPLAAPGQRLEVAGQVFASWWPEGTQPCWPELLAVNADLVRSRPSGLGRGTAIELAVNAVLPVALASGAWSEAEAWEHWRRLPSPGTYGRLRQLEGWLGGGAAKPFGSAARLQGGLLLHGDYCTKGACGRCPMDD